MAASVPTFNTLFAKRPSAKVVVENCDVVLVVLSTATNTVLALLADIWFNIGKSDIFTDGIYYPTNIILPNSVNKIRPSSVNNSGYS